MAIQFPTSIDDLANVSVGDTIAIFHKNDLNDYCEALATKIGVDSSAVATSHDYMLRNLPAQDSDWDAGGYEVRALKLQADVVTGTAPLTITSTTVVANLNVDKLDGADLDTDGTLAGNSDTSIPSEKAVKTYVDTQVATKTTLAAALEAVYPVGSIYINATSSTNPATLLGFGTWSAFGAGKVPVGYDSGDSDFNAAEKTGGAKTVNAAHTHEITKAWSSTAENRDPEELVVGRTGQSQISNAYRPSGNKTSESGGSASQSTLQPYITVYMWKRTA